MVEVKTVIDNKKQAEIQQSGGQSVYPTTEILGSMEIVKDFALFYQAHAKDLEVIEASHLLDFANTQSFTPGEFKMYRMGLEAARKFFEASEQDLTAYALEAEKQNKSS